MQTTDKNMMKIAMKKDKLFMLEVLKQGELSLPPSVHWNIPSILIIAITDFCFFLSTVVNKLLVLHGKRRRNQQMQ
jgi:hypothetical protein